jgi:hypothetical protein
MVDKFLYLNGGRPTEKPFTSQSTGAPDAGKGLALHTDGKLHPSVMPPGTGMSVLERTASEALAAGDFVNLWDDSGTIKARKADASTAGKPADGYVVEAVAQGQTAAVYTDVGSVNAECTGLTPGALHWLSTVAGALTTTPPTAAGALVQVVGRAVSATSLIFRPQEMGIRASE